MFASTAPKYDENRIRIFVNKVISRVSIVFINIDLSLILIVNYYILITLSYILLMIFSARILGYILYRQRSSFSALMIKE